MIRFAPVLLGVAAALGMLLAASNAPQRVHALANCDTDSVALDGEEAAFLGLINDYRASRGLARLTASVSLNRDAAWMVGDMGRNNRFGHTDSIGRSPFQRSVDCGYPLPAGENIAGGTNRDSAASAFELFRNSPPHNENMLEPTYRQVGVARIHVAGSTYGWYWATEFGTADDGGAAAPPAPTPTPEPPPPPATPVQQAAPPAAKVPVVSAASNPPPATATEPEVDPAAVAIERFETLAGRWQALVNGLPRYFSGLNPLRRTEAGWVLGVEDRATSLRLARLAATLD